MYLLAVKCEYFLQWAEEEIITRWPKRRDWRIFREPRRRGHHQSGVWSLLSPRATPLLSGLNKKRWVGQNLFRTVSVSCVLSLFFEVAFDLFYQLDSIRAGIVTTRCAWIKKFKDET